MSIGVITQALGTAVEFLDYLARATPIALALAGLLGYYYREKIKAVLAKSLAVDIESLRHQFAKDLSLHTSTLQRELEAYKVGLIADAERLKAAQDIRKAIALRVAERRFAAIAALLDVHIGIDTDIGSLITLPQSREPNAIEAFLRRKQELFDRFSKYSEASHAAQLFISDGLRRKVLDVRQATLTVLGLRNGSDSPAISQDHHDIRSLLEKSNDLERDLRHILEEFERA